MKQTILLYLSIALGLIPAIAVAMYVDYKWTEIKMSNAIEKSIERKLDEKTN